MSKGCWPSSLISLMCCLWHRSLPTSFPKIQSYYSTYPWPPQSHDHVCLYKRLHLELKSSSSSYKLFPVFCFSLPGFRPLFLAFMLCALEREVGLKVKMKRSSSSEKSKLDRKMVEKNRRMQMKSLCLKLSSLIPANHFRATRVSFISLYKLKLN